MGTDNLIKVDFKNKANEGLLTACIAEFLQMPFAQSILEDIKRGRELSQDSAETMVEGIEDQVAVVVYYIFKEAVDGTN